MKTKKILIFFLIILKVNLTFAQNCETVYLLNQISHDILSNIFSTKNKDIIIFHLETTSFQYQGPLTNGTTGAEKYISNRGMEVVVKSHGINSSPNKEVAAYIVSDTLTFQFVPPTIMKKIKGKESSIQVFVNNSKTFREVQPWFTDQKDYNQLADLFKDTDVGIPLLESERFKKDLFDYIISNKDSYKTNGDNLLIDLQSRRVISIDHSLSFSQSYDLPDYLAQQLSSQEFQPLLKKFITPQNIKHLNHQLKNILEDHEVESLNKRLKLIKSFLKDS